MVVFEKQLHNTYPINSILLQNTTNMSETIEILDTTSTDDYGTPVQQEKLPNSSGILTLGILSIVFAGGIGIILGIIALGLSGGTFRQYKANPKLYTEGSVKNAKAGRVCAIIGVSIAGLIILFLLFALIAAA